MKITDVCVSGGPLKDFKGGWAIIPFTETAHFWIADKSKLDCIDSGKRIQFWNSRCGRAKAVTGGASNPLDLGSFAQCRLCYRMNK